VIGAGVPAKLQHVGQRGDAAARGSRRRYMGVR
jgi:hypothetical protein